MRTMRLRGESCAAIAISAVALCIRSGAAIATWGDDERLQATADARVRFAAEVHNL